MRTAIVFACVLICWCTRVLATAVNVVCPAECSCSSALTNNRVNAVCEDVDDLTSTVSKLPNSTTSLTVERSVISTLESDCFLNAPLLEVLNLNNSKIEEIIPGAYQGLQYLKTLNLSDNFLKSMEDGDLRGLSALETLDLSRNGLIDMGSPGWLSRSPNLRFLYLDGNRITQLASGIFQNSENLELLSLTDNRLTDIGSTVFTGLLNLKTLRLNGNMLTSVPSDALASIKSPQFTYLDLSNNPIRILENYAFNNDGGKNLKGALYLNNLDLIPDEIEKHAFVGLQELRSLYLSGNHLHLLQSAQFAPMEKLMFIALSGNPLVCDCRMLDFVSYVEVTLHAVTGLCDQPIYLRRHPITNLQLSEFRCEQPMIKDHAGNLSVQVGNSATFCCNVQNHYLGDVEIEWFHDDRRLRYEDKNCLMKNNISPTDGGLYVCVAMTSDIYDEVAIALIVHQLPRSSDTLPHLTGTSNEETPLIAIATNHTLEDDASSRHHKLIIVSVLLSTGSAILIALLVVYGLVCRRQRRPSATNGIASRGLISESMAVPLVEEDSLEMTNSESAEIQRAISRQTRTQSQTSDV